MIETVYSAHEVAATLQHLPKGSHIFIDIDDTIITPLSKTFRAPPHNQLIDSIKEQKESYPHYEAIVSQWRLQRKVMLLDAAWPALVQQWQEHHEVYGLTKMNSGPLGAIPSTEDWRYQELRGMGVRFYDNPLLPYPGLQSDQRPVFYRGLFITGNHSKSQTIEAYRQLLRPHHVVMVDDRREHLEDIGAWCLQHAIPYQGLWYRGLERLTDRQDPDIAAYQKQRLIEHGEWLEDEEAARRHAGHSTLP